MTWVLVVYEPRPSDHVDFVVGPFPTAEEADAYGLDVPRSLVRCLLVSPEAVPAAVVSP